MERTGNQPQYTVNDKQVFLKDENKYLRHFMNGNIGISWRPAINTRHSFGIGFSSEEVGDTIVALNPEYFTPGKNKIGYQFLLQSDPSSPGLYPLSNKRAGAEILIQQKRTQ